MTFVPLTPSQFAGLKVAIGFVEGNPLEFTLGYLESLGIAVPTFGTVLALAAWIGFEIITYETLRSRDMACVSKHSTTVPGAGLCCTAVNDGRLSPPPSGTILPVYVPGSSGTLPPGRITQVTDSGGHCASCMIVGSSSAKHRGRPVLKFIRGGPGCPTAGQGCCVLSTGGLLLGTI